MSLVDQQRDFHSHILSEEAVDWPGWDDRMQAGMAVYRNAYRARLMECMQASYDKTWSWVGDESFNAAAAHHLILNPPKSWTLDAIGLGFDETLHQLFADDPEVAELAWLEWEMQQAFVAEDVAPVDGAAFAEETSAFDDEGWTGLRLSFAPSLKVRSVQCDIAAIWSAISKEEAVSDPIALSTPAKLIVWREGLRPCFRQLDAEEGEALDMMQDGKSFGAMCDALSRSGDEDSSAARAGAMLGRWIADGLIIGLA